MSGRSSLEPPEQVTFLLRLLLLLGNKKPSPTYLDLSHLWKCGKWGVNSTGSDCFQSPQAS